MAAENPVASLQEEATCPICLEYFRQPVSLECGHNFCRGCITQCWEGSDPDHVSCPHCRETLQHRILIPNRQLRNMVEIAKRLSLQPAKGAGRDKMCGEHQEALKLFCEEDQALICLVCRESRAHRAHTAVPIEEAAQEYKEKIQAHLETLRKEKEKLLGLKVTAEKRSQDYLKQTQTERQKIVSEFQQLRQFLEEQERLLLAQLEQLEREMVKIQDDNVSKASEEISHLSDLISEVEGKCQKPASEFLPDVRSTLSRCEKEKFWQPEKISPRLEQGLSDFSQKTVALMETMRKFKDTLPSALEGTQGESLGSFKQATVTLDPDTAHRWLVLSRDGKSVRCGEIRQGLPYNPERFDTDLCVLGREGFTSGRHCWEVEAEVGQYWVVGVARESVRRKERISYTPEEGIWAVRRLGDQFEALTSPVTPLPQSRVPNRIWVCLDCDRRQVTFFDAGDETPIFTFPPGSVTRERLQPWLNLWDTKTWLRLYP